MRVRPALAWVLGLAALMVGPRPASAQATPEELEINIAETVWGFDGKAVRETFIPLSILVQNTGSKMASGTLRLTRTLPLDVAREPPVDVPFDIPPFEERWVQVVPFITDDYVPYELSWGPGKKQKVELPQARLGNRATVLLVNPNERARPSGALKRFRSHLFPVSITATDGLEAVFLDSVPDFQGARLQAFLEWLKCGGTVVLLHGENQAFPKFPSALAALNEPGETVLIGAGQVRRLALEARDVDEAQVRLAIANGKSQRTSRETATAFGDAYRTYNGRFPWDRDRKVLEKLESVSRFERRWWIIYPLALLYLLAVFPGSFAVARAPRGVRWFYITYFASALIFGWGFKTLGGVGGGAKSRIRSATIAHQVSPGVFDCSQWNSIAAVDGGWFSLSHEGSGRAYAPSEEFEIPRGLVTVGTSAKYEVDIPVASTRTAVCRFRANAPAVTAELRNAEFTDGKLVACSAVFGGLPSAPLEAFVCYRDSILRLQSQQDVWTTDRRRSMTTSVFVSNLDRLPDYSVATRQRTSATPLLSSDFYRTFDRLLVGNAFQIRDYVEPWSAVLPPGLVRVMALVEADRAFAGRIEGFDDVQGCVLYVIDLPVSGN